MMGTRADFYVGRGTDAEWLGSIAWDGYSIDDAVRAATTEDDYRWALGNFFGGRNDVTLPDAGWPWPWATSHTTDYAYAFDGGSVWGSRFGEEWWPALHEPDTWDEVNEVEIERSPLAIEAFPDMSARKNVQMGGKRSGLIVISASYEEEQS